MDLEGLQVGIARRLGDGQVALQLAKLSFCGHQHVQLLPGYVSPPPHQQQVHAHHASVGQANDVDDDVAHFWLAFIRLAHVQVRVFAQRQPANGFGLDGSEFSLL